MRLLFDENTPFALARELSGHVCSSVARLGWRGTENGALLSRAAAFALPWRASRPAGLSALRNVILLIPCAGVHFPDFTDTSKPAFSARSRKMDSSVGSMALVSCLEHAGGHTRNAERTSSRGRRLPRAARAVNSGIRRDGRPIWTGSSGRAPGPWKAFSGSPDSVFQCAGRARAVARQRV